MMSSGRGVASIRTRAIVAGIVASVVAVNIVVSLSGRAAIWWDRFSRHGQRDLPSPLRRLFDARPYSLEDADVHALMWFVATAAVMLLFRTWRARAAVAASMLALGAALELAQSRTTTRTAEWKDVIGNVIGVTVAALVVSLWSWFARSRARRMTQ